jgi:signal transduction histidine kinase
MSRPDQAPADAHGGASSLARGAAVVGAVLATSGVLALAAIALLPGRPAAESAASFGWFAATMACAATAVTWVLWTWHTRTRQRRQARSVLREHDQLHALLATLPIPAFVLDGPADAPSRVRVANEAASHWLGLASAELTGLALPELQARLPRDARAALTQALAADRVSARPHGGSGWTVRAAPIDSGGRATLPDAGRARRWLLTVLAPPVTAPTTDDLGSAHESFGYTVSHDLRAPIRVVEGFTRILKEDYGSQLDRIGNDHLDRVLGAAERMNSMIDALLALSQLSSRPLARQPVDLSQIATYVVDDLRRQSPERAVAVHIAPGLQTQGDPTLLRLVLENLLGNAWKYSARSPAAQIWFERGRRDGRTVFSVRDNGAGFDMRFAERLFGVFQRLHSANDFPGTGVGLASVRRIVSRHGGEVWAESVVDRGSSFHFTLPADDAGA